MGLEFREGDCAGRPAPQRELRGRSIPKAGQEETKAGAESTGGSSSGGILETPPRRNIQKGGFNQLRFLDYSRYWGTTTPLNSDKKLR